VRITVFVETPKLLNHKEKKKKKKKEKKRTTVSLPKGQDWVVVGAEAPGGWRRRNKRNSLPWGQQRRKS